MTGIILLTYPNYGNDLVSTASHVLGKPLDNIGIVQILPDYKTVTINQQLIAKINELQNTNGILILCDIYGATHCNIACKVIEQGKVEMVSGLNLPMLIRSINYRDEPVSKLSEIAAAGGTESIKILNTNSQCSSQK